MFGRGWLEVGIDAFGVREGELLEGLFPVRRDVALDESPVGFSLACGESAFLLTIACSFVFDVADREPEQLESP